MKKELTVEAKIDNVQTVTDFVNESLETLDLPMKAVMQIDVIIDEIFGNIAHYAYGDETGKATVTVKKKEDENCVVLIFSDNGIPYDPLKKEDPNVKLTAEEREIGGLGIFMAKKMSDYMEYEYRDGQNILKITKNV